jgi:hypothetical protein
VATVQTTPTSQQRQDPHDVIAYHHHMGGEYEIVGTDILEVCKADYALYDEIDE